MAKEVFQPFAEQNKQLINAVNNGSITEASKLLAAGAKIDHISSAGQTPLMHAIRFGQEAMVSFLISKNAPLTGSEECAHSALHYALHIHSHAFAWSEPHVGFIRILQILENAGTEDLKDKTLSKAANKILAQEIAEISKITHHFESAEAPHSTAFEKLCSAFNGLFTSHDATTEVMHITADDGIGDELTVSGDSTSLDSSSDSNH